MTLVMELPVLASSETPTTKPKAPTTEVPVMMKGFWRERKSTPPARAAAGGTATATYIPVAFKKVQAFAVVQNKQI